MAYGGSWVFAWDKPHPKHIHQHELFPGQIAVTINEFDISDELRDKIETHWNDKDLMIFDSVSEIEANLAEIDLSIILGNNIESVLMFPYKDLVSPEALVKYSQGIFY